MRAVVLAGGAGLRLRPYTTVLPKPLVPVGDRPVVEHILYRLAAAGVADVHLCVGHLGGLIQAYFSEEANRPRDLRLHWHWEHRPLGTAGALRSVEGLQETFLAVNGDVLTTVEFRDLVDFHRAQDATLTIATGRKRVELGLGVLSVDRHDVVDYREKPALEYVASLGIYVYEPRVLEHIPEGTCQFPDLVRHLLAAGERVAAFPTDGETFDIGTVDEHRRASEALVSRPEDFR
ncbi:MAG TPA: sugar phosphate nucleotidyltransferase [Solirubrobacteraceae bacterium]|nr:sugar phosphate nucleotidyltransferase [Solirubrobacteraceae bacterium]